MAKRASRVTWCDRPPYWPLYGFAPDQDSWYREMRKMGSSTPYPVSHGATAMFEGEHAMTACLVTVSAESCPKTVAGILAHEAVHVYQQVLAQMGEKKPGDECQAYGIQEIFVNLVDAYEQTRGRLFLKGVSAETVA